MGVRDCFGKLFGPDLVDAFKPQRIYYERIFADTVVDPADAVVVDDFRPSIEAAAELGAWGVLVSASPQPDLEPRQWISALAELPQLLDGSR
jgi:FMN phosphatase YigB (HAD superfamily)